MFYFISHKKYGHLHPRKSPQIRRIFGELYRVDLNLKANIVVTLTSGSISTIVHTSLALLIQTHCMRTTHLDYSMRLILITGRPLGDRLPLQHRSLYITMVILSMQNNFILPLRRLIF